MPSKVEFKKFGSDFFQKIEKFQTLDGISYLQAFTVRLNNAGDLFYCVHFKIYKYIFNFKAIISYKISSSANKNSKKRLLSFLNVPRAYNK